MRNHGLLVRFLGLRSGFKIAALAAGLVVLQTQYAQAGKCPAGTVSVGTKCGTPVTTEIEVLDANSAPTTISDDGLGVYQHGNGVLSFLLEDGVNGLKHDWRFDVRGSSSRNVTETVNSNDQTGGDPVSVADYPSLDAPLVSKAFMNVQCTWVGVDMLTMTVAGGPRTCPLLNTFGYVGGNYYSLHASRSFPGPDPDLEVTDVQVTCTAEGSPGGRFGCTAWTIEPIDAEAIGRLVKVEVTRKKETKTVLGLFNMRLLIHVTRP